MFEFQLPDGRAIQLVSLSVEQTYSGVMEGSRETASVYIREDLYRRIARHIPNSKPLLLDDYRSELPHWLCMGLFKSYSGARNTDIDAASQLWVVWFMEDNIASLEDGIRQILPRIDWKNWAEDYDLMDF